MFYNLIRIWCRKKSSIIFSVIGLSLCMAFAFPFHIQEKLHTGFSHKLVYFEKSGETILVNGGPEKLTSNRRMELWKWLENTWAKVETPNAPVLRNGFAVACDSKKEILYLFGGGDQDIVYSDFWKWDGKSWIQIMGTGPGKRIYAQMCYNEATQKLVLFGGDRYEGDVIGDTWEFDGKSWSQVSVTGPEPRLPGQMEYFEKKQKVVLYGGLNFSDTGLRNDFNDLWEWDGKDWLKVYDGQGTLKTLIHPGMVLYPESEKMMMFGGSKIINRDGKYENPYTNEVWFWDGVNWHPGLTPATGLPGVRSGTSLIFEKDKKRLLLHGGFNVVAGEPLNDTWVCEHGVWRCVFSCN